MSKTRTAALIAATAAAALLASAGAASAAPRPAPAPSLVLALTHLTDRPDGGNGNPDPYWADDTFTRTLLIIRTGGSAGDYTFTAVIADTGTFTTIKGEQAPNQGPGYAGDVIKSKVTGTMTGYADFTFTASALPAASLVPASENDRGNVPADDTSTWYELAFPADTTFGGDGIGAWSWTYGVTVTTAVGRVFTSTQHQQWTDALSNGYGDLSGDGQITG